MAIVPQIISCSTTSLSKEILRCFSEAMLPLVATEPKIVVAICGGRTINLFLQGLKEADSALPRTFWEKTHWVVTDDFPSSPERPKTNSVELYENFFKGAEAEGLVPPGNFHPFNGSSKTLAELQAAAVAYSKNVLALKGGVDAVILGSGGDVYWPSKDQSSPIDPGHVAAIFPGQSWSENDPLYLAYEGAPKPPLQRMTITPRYIRSAAIAIGIISGTAKANALANFLSPNIGSAASPIKLLTEGESSSAKRYLITDISISSLS